MQSKVNNYFLANYGITLGHLGKKCAQCKSSNIKLGPCPSCKSIFLCSQQCYQNHLKTVHKIGGPNNQPIVKNQNKYREGIVGLQNMGNTCYMNSCIQCLSHTKQLTTYFLSKFYQKQINLQNTFGSKGLFVQAYYTCMQNLWIKKNQTFRPAELKKIIALKNKQFQNFDQQDACQFFSTVIDTIHEDLNRSKIRVNIEMKDISGKSDSEGAKASWLHYLVNNQSIIIDLMTGLFKSVITCTVCKKVSKKFDIFSMINLPIPQDYKINRYPFYVMYYQKPYKKDFLQFKQINFQKIKSQALQIINKKNHENFKLYFLSKTRQAVQITDKNLTKQQFKLLVNQDPIFLIQLSPEEKQLTMKYPLTSFFSHQKGGVHSNLWLKRPFFIDLQKQTDYSLTKTILRFLYIYCYKQKLRKTIYGIEGKQYLEYQQQMMDKYQPIRLILARANPRNDDYILREVTYSQRRNFLNGKMIPQLDSFLEETETSVDIRKIKLQLIIEMQDNNANNDFFDLDRLPDCNPKQKSEKKQVNLQECFDAFNCQEHLNVLSYCQQCEAKTKISKTMNIYRSPDILVIVLNRFKLVENGTRTKNNIQVNFPFELDLQKYVIENIPMGSYIEVAKKLIDYKKPAYKYQPNLSIGQKFQLYAVVNHYGSLNSGHYNAYAKNQLKWFLFNDSKVTQVHQISPKNAYMLFYRRKNH